MKKKIKRFIPHLLLVVSVGVMMWIVTAFSLNRTNTASCAIKKLNGNEKDASVSTFLVASNEFHKYLNNLSEELGKQKKQISALMSRVDELKSSVIQEGSTIATTNVKWQESANVENRLYERAKENHLKLDLNTADIFAGIPINNEFEVVPFTRFTANRLYLVEPGLGRRVIEKPIGYKRKDLTEVVDFAVEKLNNNSDSRFMTYTTSDFLEGIYRTLPGFGTQYELYFRNFKEQNLSQCMKVIVTRLFTEPSLILKDRIKMKDKLINLILPLSGRLDSFKRFMDNFVKVCIHLDRKVYLTVVYFGREGFAEVQSIVSNISIEHDFKPMQIILLEETFSRSKGLQIGIQKSNAGNNVLLFICDVDIIFSTDFLERCRLHAESGLKVYYPIVFSLFNPKIVHAFQNGQLAYYQKELVISKETGFWRDFGYGMTCQYRQDFLRMKGFDEPVSGWGMEDVYLYRKYVKSNMLVVRAADPGIFHIWHEKYCDPKLSPERYRGCIRSKALNEASHSQLGILAFKDEIYVHQGLRTNQV